MRLTRYGNMARASLMAGLCGALALGMAACGGGGGGGSSAAPATVLGRIVNLSGTPISGVTVTIGGRTFLTGSNSIGLGNFALTNVPSDATTLTVAGTGVKTLTQTLGLLTPNATNDLGDIFVLDATDTTGAYTADVKGVVVRSDTLAPISGALVRLSGHVATTGASGAFQFTGLPTGLGESGNVGDVTASGFTPTAISFQGLVLGASPPVNDLGNVVLASVVGPTPGVPTNINGKVSLQGLTDLSGTTVTLTKKSDGSTVDTQVTKAGGLYGFFVVAGTYTVKVQHTGFANQQADITLTRPDLVQTKNFTLIP